MCSSPAFLFAISVLFVPCLSFTAIPISTTSTRTDISIDSSLKMFFAEDVASSNEPADGISLSACSGEESSIQSITEFMVDAFWLNSPQLLVQGDSNTEVSDATRAGLVEEQFRDLMDKYSERLGKRLLNSCMITATLENELVGVVGIEVCLFNKKIGDIISADKAEAMLKNAVASLGPKQRRQYKDSSLDKLVDALLPPEIQAISCLSNLAVSPNVRNKGIAKSLCQEAERICRDDWGYKELYLKVESENTAARNLYEQKLGYTSKSTLKDEVALRVDADSGSFVEINADTLVLVKQL